MATTALMGTGIIIPVPNAITMAPSFANLTFAATGDKASMIGSIFWNGTDATKDIRKVHWRWGAITKAGGSALTFSLQNIDLAAGPVIRPDGTQDQTAAITNASITASTWHTSGNLSTDRTVSFGERFAAVWEFDGAGRLGADSIALAGLTLSSTGIFPVQQQGCCVTSIGGTWAVQTVTMNIIFEFSDGSFGTFIGAIPASALNTHTFNSSSTPDEYAMKMTPDFEIDVNGIASIVGGSTGGDYDMVLYAGTTALATVSVDQSSTISTTARHIINLFAKQNLTAATDYYIAIKPTTTTNVSVYSVDVSDVLHFDLTGPFGNEMTYATRTDAGAWTETTTRRLMAGLCLAGIPSSGGGLAANPIRGFTS